MDTTNETTAAALAHEARQADLWRQGVELAVAMDRRRAAHAFADAQHPDTAIPCRYCHGERCDACSAGAMVCGVCGELATSFDVAADMGLCAGCKAEGDAEAARDAAAGQGAV